jgi:hypothetical protein
MNKLRSHLLGFTVLTLALTSISNRGQTITDWRAAIDSTWGVGISTSEKLAIFDNFWTTIDEEYAGFNNLDVDWDSLNSYRDTVAAGVSRGRFYGIISYMWMQLLERHTALFDRGIAEDDLDPGVPLFVPSGWFPGGHFGAGLTPLPDSSLLVYQVADAHPMVLEPGDIVLGYEGILWKDLYPELLEAQLPIALPWMYISNWGSSPESMDHGLLSSAGMNWHLFDTLDVVKYESGDTLHLATAVLDGAEMEINNFEQLPVSGIQSPSLDEKVTWGMVDDTQIGYIYLITTTGSIEEPFSDAVTEFMNDDSLAGLILDLRTNFGGDLLPIHAGYRQLFGVDQDRISFFGRNPTHPDDHLAMVPYPCIECPLSADPGWFEKPIAVLLGPHCVSGGDYAALLINQHPMARTFGKRVNTSLVCAVGSINVGAGWTGWLTNTTGFLEGDSLGYLMHVGFPVDEEVWLEKNDVALGYDTVVGRAIEWIQNVAYAHEIEVNNLFAQPGVDTVWVTAQVDNPNEHELQLSSYIFSSDSSIHDSLLLIDDGNHNDGIANDGIWGAGWPTVASESNYTIDFTTTDVTDGTSRTLPKTAWFTTIGPLVQVGYHVVNDDYSNPGDHYFFHLDILNQSDSITVPNVSVQLRTIDSLVVADVTRKIVGHLAPGQVDDARYLIVDIAEFEPTDTLSLPVGVDIYSNNTLYWVDTLLLTIHPVGLDEGSNKWPSEYALIQNYPNPFNPSTTISYGLPELSDVRITIYDITGRQVVQLVNKPQEVAGYHYIIWSGMDSEHRPVSTGLYFTRIEAGEYTKTIKMLYLK